LYLTRWVHVWVSSFEPPQKCLWLLVGSLAILVSCIPDKICSFFGVVDHKGHAHSDEVCSDHCDAGLLLQFIIQNLKSGHRRLVASCEGVIRDWRVEVNYLQQLFVAESRERCCTISLKSGTVMDRRILKGEELIQQKTTGLRW
jgi:hypothetical protein